MKVYIVLAHVANRTSICQVCSTRAAAEAMKASCEETANGLPGVGAVVLAMVRFEITEWDVSVE